MSHTATTYPCPCGATMEPRALVEAVQAYDVGTRLFQAVCPACNAAVALRAGDAGFEWGFTYWAGSLHFESVGSVVAPGLTCRELPEEEAIALSFADRTRHFPIPASVGYLELRRGDHAVGRTLRQLDLESIGVEVRSMLAPGYVPRKVDRGLPLEEGARLEFFGKLSARHRAAKRVRSGA